MLRITAAARKIVKKPLGRLFLKVPARKEGFMITVGDAVTVSFLKKGITPDVIIYDNREKRRTAQPVKKEIISSVRKRKLAAKNPRGTITNTAWKAVREAIRRKAKLEIDGEEDLLTIPALLEAPTGAVVWYGQPGKGVIKVVADVRSRSRALRALKLMKWVIC